MESDDVNHEILRQLKWARESENGEFLKFEKPIALKEGHIRGVYIRACYRRLLDVVTSNVTQKSLILGDPGVGKTYFSYFLLF